MQNYLFNFVIRVNLGWFVLFYFDKKTNSFLQLNYRYSKANNFSQAVPWPVQDYRKTYSHLPSGPRHELWHSDNKLFNTLLTTNFFSFLRETLLRWRLNLFQFSFVNESMFNLFVSIEPNIQKFTLLIEKVTFQKNQYKIRFFFNIWI